MSRTTRTALSLAAAALLAGCAGGAQQTIGELESTPAGGGAFTQALAQEYLALAEKEYDLLDYQDAEHFAQKGLSAASGETVGLDPLGMRTLQSEFADNVASLRAETVDYVGRFENSEPEQAARAQALFDCAFEEYEEYWQVEAQPYRLSACLDELRAMLQEGMPATVSLAADVLFDFDESSIRPEFEGVLDEIAGMIVANDEEVTIEGHTDAIGTEEYNMALGQRRADSVADYLAAQGVPMEDMTTVSYGETRPVAPNDTPEGRQLNRRVEIKR
jgi:outer membrane protein OmpA-like peptidoglycan-associated protein